MSKSWLDAKYAQVGLSLSEALNDKDFALSVLKDFRGFAGSYKGYEDGLTGSKGAMRRQIFGTPDGVDITQRLRRPPPPTIGDELAPSRRRMKTCLIAFAVAVLRVLVALVEPPTRCRW